MDVDTNQMGIVVYSIDEMAQIIGLEQAKMSELLICNLNVFAVVASLQANSTNVMLYSAANDVLESDLVLRTFDEMLLYTGFDVLSTIMDPLGNILLVDSE